MIDQALFQIIVLALSAISALLFALVKGSVGRFQKRMDSLSDIAVDHERRITENAKDIEANGKQDLIKTDSIARSIDDVKLSIRDVSTDVKNISQRLSDYIISQKR